MKIEQQLLGDVSTETISLLSSWVDSGLKGYYSGSSDKINASFGGLGAQMDAFNALCKIHRDLPSDAAKTGFVEIVRTSLVPSIKNKIPSEGIDTMMCFAIPIKSYEILEAFPQLIKDANGDLKQNIASRAISVLYNFPPSEITYNMTKQITNNPDISDDVWIFQALNVLIKYKPKDVLLVINQYLPRLEQVAVMCDNISDEELKSDAYDFIDKCVCETIGSVPQWQMKEIKNILVKFRHPVNEKNLSQSQSLT